MPTWNVRVQIDPITSVFEIGTWLGISIKLVSVIIADDPDSRCELNITARERNTRQESREL